MAWSDKKDKANKPKIDVGLNYEIIDLMIEYCLSDSPLVNLRSITNLKNLIERITYEDEVYENRLKFELLKVLLKNEVENHNFNYPLLKLDSVKQFPENSEYIEGVIKEATEGALTLTENDIDYINNFVEERLTYFYLFENRNKLKNVLEELEYSDNIEEVNYNFENIINSLYKDIQNSKSTKKDSATDFCIGGSSENFKDKNFHNMIKKTIDDLRKPSNHIKSGIRDLNDMLGGGFENGRCYLVYAPPKSWKSGLLLNIGIWACKYNEFKPKDPSKTPCVLYLTMENTAKETMKRLFAHCKNGENIRDYDYNDAVNIINDYVIGDRNISFEIKYRKNRSISTTNLDSMIDELSLEGKEVVLVIQDYMKRIFSSERNEDLRLELGAITNDFCVLARSRDIPVVSAMQINRNGISKIEAALKANKGNLATLIDKSDAGESALPLENADFVFSIIPEEDSSGDKYLGFNLWVSRVETNTKKFFLQKFENGMKLEEDIEEDSSTSIDSIIRPDINPNSFNTKNILNKVNGNRKVANSEENINKFHVQRGQEVEEEDIF